MATDVNLGMLTLEELRQLLGQGTDRYSQIMGQMGGGSPYSQIMAQTPAFQNPYANTQTGAMGGYNPNMYGNAAAARMTGRPIFGGAGGTVSGSGGGDVAPGGYGGAATYGSNNSLSNGLVAAMLGLSSQPSFGVTVENMGTYAGQPDFGFGSSMTGVGNPGESTADTSQSVSDQSSAGSEAGGYGTGDTSGGFGGGEYAMGGPVDKVGGPNPAGPDDGIGMLQLGEYVIKKSAVDKYGTGLLDMINNGKIPAKKMKSLLG